MKCTICDKILVVHNGEFEYPEYYLVQNLDGVLLLGKNEKFTDLRNGFVRSEM